MDEDQDKEVSDEEKTSEEQSDEDQAGSKKEPKELSGDLIKGLQKGYTQTRQDLSSLRGEISSLNEKLEEIAASLNQKSGAQAGDEEYVTPSSLKRILAEERQLQEKTQEKLTKQEQQRVKLYIDQVFDDLRDEGVIATEEDEKEFAAYAQKLGEANLYRAATKWVKEKEANKAKEKDKAKKEAHQKESSDLGTSKKSGGKEQGKVKYSDVASKDWSELSEIGL